MAATKRKAFSYVRFSTPGQIRGASLKRQTERSAAWAEKNGFELDTKLKLHDLGVSGFKGINKSKGRLGAFIEAVDSGEVPTGSTLIVESLDRLSREEVGEQLELFLSLLRRGITIQTLSPEENFTKKSINEPTRLIIAIVSMCRGHEESALKAERVGDAWKRKKEAARNGVKISAACPKWLKLDEDRKKFRFTESAKSVRKIVDLSLTGFGMGKICEILNQEKYPTLTPKAKYWQLSSVKKVLTTVALYGAYQPHCQITGKRIPVGEPIEDYYPAICSQAEWFQIQHGMESRRSPTAKGRTGKVPFLFKGMIFDAVSNEPIQYLDKGARAIPCLNSKLRRMGVNKSPRFPYPEFEKLILKRIRELDSRDFTTQKKSESESDLIAVRGKIKQLETRIKSLQAKLIESDEDIDVLSDAVIELNKRKKVLKEQEETLIRTMGKSNPANEVQSILELLESTPKSQLLELRTRLKTAIAELIKEIHVRILQEGTSRTIYFQIHYRANQVLESAGLNTCQAFKIQMTTVYTGGGSKNPSPERVYRTWFSPVKLFGSDKAFKLLSVPKVKDLSNIRFPPEMDLRKIKSDEHLEEWLEGILEAD